MPDLDGVAHESTLAAGRGGGAGAALPRRFLHFVLDLGDVLAEPAGGVAPAVPAGRGAAMPAQVHFPGIVGTRMLLRASNRSVLSLPRITSLCQERALWRAALRFAGVSNSVLPELWRRLARDAPPLFRCGGPDGAAV